MLSVRGFGVCPLMLRASLLVAWARTVVSVLCGIAQQSMSAGAGQGGSATTEVPSKARLRDTMYQLSLCFAWNRGAEQGTTYKALNMFCREPMRLSEDLRDHGPLLAWTGLCEAIVQEELEELLNGVYPAAPKGEVTPTWPNGE